ncbi:hypothetical protein CICLE_v10013339mg [Citrus x clementina]|uniref:F-box domain-containing protein n=1 Tax=Citrus clementina TaxID=85681 RepID=V4T4F1_CITCL|nr:hypothetical protein CICLE_v10013339mg [Citrus x clementina]
MDRISELPHEILHQVLSSITTKSAIHTSILSKRWQHLWKFTSTVHFSPSLVEFALAHHVQVLVLNFKTSPLPDTAFDFTFSSYINNRSLKQISLGCANINPPLGCQGFASLKSLGLWRCKLTDEITRETLLKCELLESLIIDKCRELKHVKIFGPRLKHVTFVRRPQRYTLFICLVHLPCLAEANLFLDSSDNVIGIDVVKALLDEKLSHVEPLGVDYWFLRVMIPNLSFLSFFFLTLFLMLW